jgi:hypothetical protein
VHFCAFSTGNTTISRQSSRRPLSLFEESHPRPTLDMKQQRLTIS